MVTTGQDALLRAAVSYQKKLGLLELTATHVQWTAQGTPTPSLKIRTTELGSLFCSKEGAAHVRLKLGILGAPPQDQGYFFTFSSARASQERDEFKTSLSGIISRNRNTPPAQSPSSAKPSAANNAAKKSGSSSPAPQLSPADYALRKTVILKHPELAQLHRALVVSGQISETEFWEGREHLLLAEERAAAQRRGKAGPLLEIRPSAESDGKIKLTPQRILDIFDAFPVVKRAFDDNVPAKLTEELFWKRYLSSKLFNSHRASIRTAATQHVVKDDPIFDKYLEPEDDQLEPRRRHKGGIDVFLDLEATNEDHPDTGNTADVTMQPGKQRAVLPLIRRFNEHSERLLTSALGDLPPAKRRRVDTGDGVDNPFSEIDIPDLHDETTAAGIALEMKDRQRYFEARSGTSAGQGQAVDLPSVLLQSRVDLRDWAHALGALRIDGFAAQSALQGMTETVAARAGGRNFKKDIPEALLSEMTSMASTTNEFLRQFWAAVYPPDASQMVGPAPTLAQRREKAGKMAAYLGNTHSQIDSLARDAQARGLEPARVSVAMQPLVDAVDRALDYYYNQFSKAPSAVAARKPLLR